tara:strand:- start:1047 stop:1583 length:537 start_codon:yes stop_codon:yes gene_type:complete
MSRIGKLPIGVPDKVDVKIDGGNVNIKGPLGEIDKAFDHNVVLTLKDGVIGVEPANSSKLARAMHGTARSIINSMVIGVSKGYSKELIINGVGFKAAVKGDVIDLALGYSHPIEHKIPAGIKVTVTENTNVKVEGVDKHLVGQVAASIKSYYPVEPYKGKGVRIVGEFVRRKEGKKTA